MMQSVKRRRLWEMDAELRKEWNYVKQNSPTSSFERGNPVREEERSFEKDRYQEPFQQSRRGLRQTKPYDAFPDKENMISKRENQRPLRSSRRGFTAMDAELQKQWNHAKQHSSTGSFEHRTQQRGRELPFQKDRYQEPFQRLKRDSRSVHPYDTFSREEDMMPQKRFQGPVRGDGQTFGKRQSYQSEEEWQRRTEQALQNLGNNIDPRSGNFQGYQTAPPSREPSIQALPDSSTSAPGIYQSLADRLYQKPQGPSRVPVYISPKETPINDFVKKDPLPKINLAVEVANQPTHYNTSASIVLRNSQEHILYCLRDRQTKLSIASPLVGNSNDLVFTTNPIIKDHLCDILAIDPRIGAFAQLLKTVQIHSKLNDDLTIYPLDAKVDQGEKTLIVLENPQEGMTYNLYDASNQLIEDAHHTTEYQNKITGKELVIGDDNTIGSSFVHWEAEHTNQYFLTPTISATTDFYLKAISSSGEEVQSSNITIEL
ncbi:MAG: hypothetical protein HRT70_04405 [Flavobacteriaceae bacterium]|nr:hypothetical protein [Flavobacteriaceae bacterium]